MGYKPSKVEGGASIELARLHLWASVARGRAYPLRQLLEFHDRLIQYAYKSAPQGAHITRYAMYRALRDRLAVHDSPDKRAAVISRSQHLARLVGLRKTQLLLLDYPEFTLENLAISSESCDFVISDQVLEHCRDLPNVLTEAMRVLKPGGWFVHTTCFVNRLHSAPSDYWRFTPQALAQMFPQTEDAVAEGWGNRVATDLMENGYRFARVPNDPDNPIHQIATHSEPDWPISTWVVGRRSTAATELPRTVETRRAIPTSYRFESKPARFGVVACARNEAPYLLEWIAHYRMLGFEQITIYDNESNDATAAILRPLAEAGIINAEYWPSAPRRNKQGSAYQDARQRLAGLVEWCLFVDLDEYMLLDEGVSLNDLVPSDGSIAGVVIPWLFYGSGGQQHRTLGLTIERFTRTAGTYNGVGKSLVRLRDARYVNVHVPDPASGRLTDLWGREVLYTASGKMEHPFPGPPRARISHYFCRSLEEYECKRARGRGAVAPDAADGFRNDEHLTRLDHNSMELTDMLRMVPAVRNEVERLRDIVRRPPAKRRENA